MPRYEFVEGSSSKFWEIELAGTNVTVTFGRIGTAGQTKVKQHASAAVARAEHDKLVAEKTKKGYRPAGGAGKAAAPAKAKSVPPPPPIQDAAPKQVKDLRALALKAAADAPASPYTRTYILALTTGKRGVMRAGGSPIGVTEKTRPRWGDGYMDHLITLDLDAMPEVRAAHKSLAKARALALFISNAKTNEAFDDDTDETAVVALTAADLARGEWTGPAVGDPKGSALAAWPVDVPAAVFTIDRYGDELDDDAAICQLHDKLMSACRAGGKVVFWSGDGDDGDPSWVFQFNEDLVDVNLGDAGTMYVFTKSAHWDCH